MAHLNSFTLGWLTPVVAYLACVMGSLLGLLCTVRAQDFRPIRQHVRWLVLASVAIGGTGVWLMHFCALIGVGVPGSVVRYDMWLTIGSAVLAILVAGCGVFIVGYGARSRTKVVLGGVFTGLGEGVMHSMGVAAMHVDGAISSDVRLVVASFGIAIVANTVALWFTVTLRTGPAVTVAALIMGLAVSGTHYTGMAAVRVRLNSGQETVSGVDPLGFMIPVTITAFVILVFLLICVTLGPSREDIEVRDRLFAAAAPARVERPGLQPARAEPPRIQPRPRYAPHARYAPPPQYAPPPGDSGTRYYTYP